VWWLAQFAARASASKAMWAAGRREASRIGRRGNLRREKPRSAVPAKQTGPCDARLKPSSGWPNPEDGTVRGREPADKKGDCVKAGAEGHETSRKLLCRSGQSKAHPEQDSEAGPKT